MVGFGALPFLSCLMAVGEGGGSFSLRSALFALAIFAVFLNPLGVGDSLSNLFECVGDGVRSSATGDKRGALIGVGS